jgi:hypothetical protein
MASEQNPDIDDSLFYLVVLLVFIAQFWMFSDFYKGAWVNLKIGEIYLMKPFHFMISDNSIQMLNYYESALQDSNKLITLDIETIIVIERNLFFVYVWLYPAFLIFSGIKRIFSKPKNEYTEEHTMDTLIEQETKTIWRFNRHLNKYNPLNETLDITEGVYSIRLKELKYCTLNNILVKQDIEDKNYIFQRDVAIDKFKKQMGPLYYGTDSMLDQERWLLAAFLLFVSNSKEFAFDIMGDASFYYNDEMKKEEVNQRVKYVLDSFKAGESKFPAPTFAEKLHSWSIGEGFKIKGDETDYKFGQNVLVKTEKKHAYTYTLLMGVFEQAKDMGEFSAAKFTWIKTYNRELHFSLLDVGMEGNGSIEAAGPETHYQAELAFEKKLSNPEIILYVDYLQDKMKEYTTIAAES